MANVRAGDAITALFNVEINSGVLLAMPREDVNPLKIEVGSRNYENI